MTEAHGIRVDVPFFCYSLNSVFLFGHHVQPDCPPSKEVVVNTKPPRVLNLIQMHNWRRWCFQVCHSAYWPHQRWASSKMKRSWNWSRGGSQCPSGSLNFLHCSLGDHKQCLSFLWSFLLVPEICLPFPLLK